MALGKNVKPSNKQSESSNDNNALKQAVDLGWASIEFKPDGTIVSANQNFIKALGYKTLKDIEGKHHRIFCDKKYAESKDYADFWKNLGAGKVNSGEFKRITKKGDEIWINASYTPIKDDKGKVTGVIKIAADITEAVQAREEMRQAQEEMAAQEEELRQNMEEMQATQEEMARVSAQANAIKSAVDTGWASIEFEPDGTIIQANDNFVSALGYSSSEKDLAGNHHAMFCDPDYTKSAEYKKFWKDLAAGEVNAGEFKRFKKDGSEIWINASYTPVTDDKGKVYKVIKIANDITKMIENRIQADAIKSAVDTGWASIEFEPDGTIIQANDNFVSALGYSSSEKDLAGNHHAMFCDPDYTKSAEYKKFWKDLAAGEVNAGEFKRFKKDGSEIWINANYTPIKDADGNVFKVIKIANDISQMVEDRANANAVKAAVDTGWASIEFYPDGTIMNANNNFVSALGYASEKDIVGNHHRMFCETDYAKSPEYKQFWVDLANGHTQAGEFRRIKKDGSEIWINANYTPVKDENGDVFKVIKIANDITAMKDVIREINEVC